MTRRPDFLLCYEKGRRYYSRNFVLFFLPHREGSRAWRLGFAVTRKTGSAVVRNRIRRLLREFFRLHQAALPGASDLVVVPKRHLNPASMNLVALATEFLPLLAVLRKNGEIKENAL